MVSSLRTLDSSPFASQNFYDLRASRILLNYSRRPPCSDEEDPPRILSRQVASQRIIGRRLTSEQKLITGLRALKIFVDIFIATVPLPPYPLFIRPRRALDLIRRFSPLPSDR